MKYMESNSRNNKILGVFAICATLIIGVSMFVYDPLIGLSLSFNYGQPPRIPAKAPLYVFGDSLYDTGTALYVDKGPAANKTPYGMTFFHHPAGRFSDGLLIPDFIAQFAKLAYPEPYTNPNLRDYTQAVNFADAASGVLPETRPYSLSLKMQTASFVEMTQKLEQQYGEAQTKKFLSKAVCLFNTGSNDYTDLYNYNAKPLPETLKSQFTNQVLGNFSIHLRTMYNRGVRKFAMQDSAPIGCFPAYRQADGSCTEELNGMARIHNARLHALCQSLALQLPGFKYSIFNMHDSIFARLSNGARYGFTETRTACCGSGPFRGEWTCGDTKHNFTVCDNPTTHLWFDGGHTTQTAYRQFAKEFWGGSNKVAVPQNLKSFFIDNLT